MYQLVVHSYIMETPTRYRNKVVKLLTDKARSVHMNIPPEPHSQISPLFPYNYRNFVDNVDIVKMYIGDKEVYLDINALAKSMVNLIDDRKRRIDSKTEFVNSCRGLNWYYYIDTSKSVMYNNIHDVMRAMNMDVRNLAIGKNANTKRVVCIYYKYAWTTLVHLQNDIVKSIAMETQAYLKKNDE